MLSNLVTMVTMFLKVNEKEKHLWLQAKQVIDEVINDGSHLALSVVV